ncbi:MAG: DUF4494 domain-containing protein [Muribaculaceae bacterium]|nr:DUF4494 domain-containing protein [Muribaculaceae bacterium]MBO5187451.1 DUF4494 domain-containing protein [Prevotella sp.]
MALYFECKVRYEKMGENGLVKKVNEPYLVDALTFTEAEARVTEEVKPFISGDFDVAAAKKTKIAEIFWASIDIADRFYLVKVNFITIDEKTSQEKKAANLILVQASDFHGALNRFEEGMKGTMADYEIAAISETPIVDVFNYVAKETTEQTNNPQKPQQQ